MRTYQLIAVAVFLAVGFGTKLFLAPSAEGNVKNSSIDVSKIHVGAMLPEQKMSDMTFVFTDNE